MCKARGPLPGNEVQFLSRVSGNQRWEKRVGKAFRNLILLLQLAEIRPPGDHYPGRAATGRGGGSHGVHRAKSTGLMLQLHDTPRCIRHPHVLGLGSIDGILRGPSADPSPSSPFALSGFQTCSRAFSSGRRYWLNSSQRTESKE